MADEKILIENYLKGDEKSLKLLFSLYLKPIYNFAYRLVADFQEAEDLTQEIFIKVWRNLRQYQTDKSFRAWIFTIARNTCFDFLRKKRVRPVISLEEAEPILAETLELPDFSPAVIEETSRAQLLEPALAGLSSEQRSLLIKHYQEGFTLQEIATSLGVSLESVKSRHRRVIAVLRQKLGR